MCSQEKMKGKNKLVPRLLGITKESVMRVDEKTKEVIQEWNLTNIKRWAASPKSFTLVSLQWKFNLSLANCLLQARHQGFFFKVTLL